MSNYEMPTLDLDALRATLSAEDFALVDLIHVKGQVRASSPKVPFTVERRARVYEWEGVTKRYYRDERVYDQTAARAYMVWRHVVFSVSPNPRHQCIPVTDDLYIDLEHDARRIEYKRLQALADAVIGTVPKNLWHGVRRWGQALGMTGTPVATAEGAVVYR